MACANAVNLRLREATVLHNLGGWLAHEALAVCGVNHAPLSLKNVA
jgi:hypothetical protein